MVKADYYEPKLNRSYSEMAEYYGCAILPARVRRPKDKPTAEGTVGKVTTWVIAALREYIKQEMDVRITSSVVEVFSGGIRICSHPRLHGRPGQYHTIPEHMPEKHRKYGEWNADRFIKWAASIGNNTEIVVQGDFGAPQD